MIDFFTGPLYSLENLVSSHLFKIPVFLTHTLEHVIRRRITPPAFPNTFYGLRKSLQKNKEHLSQIPREQDVTVGRGRNTTYTC